MDPSQDSKCFYNMETTAGPSSYHQQGTSTSSSTDRDSVMLSMLSASKPETMSASPKSSDSPVVIASVAPMISENLRQLPISSQTSVHSFHYNTSNNFGNTVEMGFPNAPAADMSDTSVMNMQKQMLDKLQSANLLSMLGNQFPSFPMQPAAPTLGFPSSFISPQLVQPSSASFLATLMQQMLSSSLNAPVAPPPVNNTNLLAQLIAQLLTAQLAQSAQSTGLLQLIQALGSMAGASSPFQASSQTSILSHLSSLDPATAKQVILMLVNQLVQSGDLTDDETCQRFVKKLRSGQSSSSWQSTQFTASSNWQCVQNMSPLNIASRKNAPFTAGNVKREMISSSDGDEPEDVKVPASISVSSSPRSARDGAGAKPVSDAAPSTFGIKVDTASELSDVEMNSEESTACQTKQRKQKNGSTGCSRKPAKQKRKSASKKPSVIGIKKDDCSPADARLAAVGRSKHKFKVNVKMDVSEKTDPSDKTLRSRSKAVKYCEEELGDWLELSDADVSSKKRKLHSRPHSNSQNSSSKQTKASRSVSCSLTQSSGVVAPDVVASCGNASNSQAVVKNEITEPIPILPKVNICHSPNVRYLFMGRTSDGMDWLNLVSYKTTASDDFKNQCLFCPMTSSEVKPVADHLANEHGDLDFVLTNIKQPTGRVTYLACRHCNFVTFEPTLIWIHFELYHGIPGIMDGSSLPQISIGDPVNVEEISLDDPVNSRGGQPAYVCLDCALCSNNSKNVAMHVVQAHPDTANFNGCFVKLMMIKAKEKDSFTFREALYDESHADVVKDVYICMLCEYSTHGAYLAMSHSLRLHQTKRLLFVCNDCEFQCTRETSFMLHMANSHQYSSVSPLLCSVTLVATLSDGTFMECEIPTKCMKTSDNLNSGSDCGKKPCNILQSTAVSSSQEKQKLDLMKENKESTLAPESKTVLLDEKVDSN